MDGSEEKLDILADKLLTNGVLPDSYEDLQGLEQKVARATRREITQALAKGSPEGKIPADWPRPVLDPGDLSRCYVPSTPSSEGFWGISTQLYELRSARNWGIGDFEDLKNLCSIAADAGADFIGLNPLHALFLAQPTHCSPYSPSNRRFLNPLYLAVDRIAGFEKSMADVEAIASARRSHIVDYNQVAALKLSALSVLWRTWQSRGLPDARLSKSVFDAFVLEGGDALFGHALFEALSAEMTEQGYGRGPSEWPQDFRRRENIAVHQFADAHQDEVLFHIWLQWLTALQLEEVVNHARGAGMQVGLYLDFAVGDVPDGSSVWAEPELALPGLHLGAPPDAFSVQGQDWGLVPLSPLPLIDRSRTNYRDLVDRTARYAGALRLDHALGLWQFFLIPEGETAAEGGYLRYPFPELVADLASVSQERKTIIVGEDLGNVPPGFRDALRKAALLGYNVLYFGDAEPDTASGDKGPSLSLACLSTHDLPPLLGWWRADDIDFAKEQGFLDEETERRVRAERRQRKTELLEAAVSAGALPEIGRALVDEDIPPLNLVVALHRLLSRTDSLLIAVRLADMVGEARSTNVPGTQDEYPNWRLKLEVSLEEMPAMQSFKAIVDAMRMRQAPFSEGG
ncbi:4-alpha-glucanotransferase [Rhizobium glycinendophyticum]|uniref:4-alpha-glucanotransferase n=1 Tax=Rhizobium glycinendophyticum TaxID=2589807 RepID=A0A504TNN1_9HYPH|nr:4-alpha-glucanotransferase [Rhizobium glycinendophyticum]TPP04258.1 4-alpha-glucanotransferase [Rhizobium glycinendophyticum]